MGTGKDGVVACEDDDIEVGMVVDPEVVACVPEVVDVIDAVDVDCAVDGFEDANVVDAVVCSSDLQPAK